MRWKTGSEPSDHMWKGFAVRNDRFRLVENSLYDMKIDPGQITNVADKYPKIVISIAQLTRSFGKKRPMMVNEDVPMSPTRPYHVEYAKQIEEQGIPKWKTPKL